MLVGRAAESALLEEVLRAARAGEGSALALVGEPGIGKTMLLRFALERAAGMTVLEARPVESELDVPYAGLSDLLPPILPRLDAIPAPQQAALASALALGPPVAADRFAVGVATLGLLAAAAEERPLLVAVDDLQWLDAASRDALLFAARRVSALPVAVIVTQRTSGPDPVARGLEHVVVGPLGPADAALLLEGSSEGLSRGVVVRLLAAARGNPLALVELPHLLTQAQRLGAEPIGDPLPTGNGLERAFAARLAPLSEHGRLAALVAAADGSGTPGVTLAALESLGSGREALLEVEALDLIRLGPGGVEFRHPLVRSAAYQAASPAQRRAAHAALAAVSGDPDDRVWHQAAAALEPDEALASQLELAGERALARGAFATGAAAFERSAALTPEPAPRGDRLVRAVFALRVVGNPTKIQELAGAAAELIEEPRVRVQLATLVAEHQIVAGDAVTAHSTLVADAERIAELDPESSSAMLCLAASPHLHRLEVRAAVALIERAWARGDPARVGTWLERVALAFARVLEGDPAGRATLLELRRHAQLDVADGHRQTSAIAWSLVWLEEYDPARAFLMWAIGVQRAGGALAYLPQSLHPLAELDFRVGRWLPALAGAHEAIDLFEETGQVRDLGFAIATAARFEAALGHDDECRRHAERAFAADVASGLLIGTAWASAALGLLELGRGDAVAAIAALEPVERIVREGGVGEPWVIQWAPDLIEAYARAGRPDRAEAVLDAFESQARATGRVSALAAAARCRGLLATNDAFESPFAAALALHDRVPTPFERARTELVHGERLRRAGRRTRARERLRSALRTFERLGAEPWAERARVELRASGQSVRTPDQRAADALTPQELQVAALVAGGATNREAASALFLSPKTIEFHLGHVYRKLGVRSRTALVHALAAP